MRYRIELTAKQLNLLLNLLGNAENADDEIGCHAEAREIGAIATCIEQQMIAGEGEV